MCETARLQKVNCNKTREHCKPVAILQLKGRFSHFELNFGGILFLINVLYFLRYSNLILNLFSLMVDANIPDIALEPDKTVKKVQLLLLTDLYSYTACFFLLCS